MVCWIDIKMNPTRLLHKATETNMDIAYNITHKCSWSVSKAIKCSWDGLRGLMRGKHCFICNSGSTIDMNPFVNYVMLVRFKEEFVSS